MKEKLAQLFRFIVENRGYNNQMQERYYRSIILPYRDSKERIISLFYHIANTQSKPRINDLAEFYKFVINDPDCLLTFSSFMSKINPKGNSNFEGLYDGILKQRGWGCKTSALFVKSIYHLHNDEYSKDLRIWNDVPNKIKEENFYLPVDAVILAIFHKLDNSIVWDFKRVNHELKKDYPPSEIEIWDDLWFWGFITQKGTGLEREFIWNENKYWALKESDKSVKTIKELKELSAEFIEILMSRG